MHERQCSLWIMGILGLFWCSWIHVAVAQTPAEQALGRNVVINGDFSRLNEKKEPDRWSIPAQANVQVMAEKGNPYLRIAYVQDHIPRKISQSIPIASPWKSLLAIARIRCKDIQSARDDQPKLVEVILQFRSSDQKVLGYARGVHTKTNLPQWTILSLHTPFFPAGCTELVVYPAIMGTGGELEVDDIVVIPDVQAKDEAAIVQAYRQAVASSSDQAQKPASSSTSSPSAKDGAFPASPWPSPTHWGQEPLETQNEHRSQICINGAWKFAPAIQTAQDAPPERGWGYVAVPGTWRPHVWPGVIARGHEGFWRDLNLSELDRAWYQRTIRIPSDWAGRKVLLELGRVSTDAKVMLDGKPVGQIRWPGGEVDLTDHIRPGQDQVLTILIVATPEEGLVLRLMENATAQITQQKSTLNSKGLTGDVLLKSRPRGVNIQDLFVKTSTRKKELALEVDLADVARSEPATLTARLLNIKGEEETCFVTQIELQAARVQTIHANWIWENPRLWDFQKPELYQLQLNVRSASGINDTYTQRFGFREFWIEGRKFFLNGVEVRLRPNVALDLGSMFQGNGVADGYARLIRANLNLGFNILELWPEDSDERGMIHNREGFVRLASEQGMMMMGAPVPINRWLRIGNGKYFFEDSQKRQEWEDRMVADWRRYRNEPSIVIWACTANYFGHEQDQAPDLIGQDKPRDDMRWTQRAALGMESINLIKKHDPTRPAFAHAGAQVGDIYTTNHYLNLIPLQDREEWLDDYARNGTMPFMAVEFGTPFYGTMLCSRAGYGQSVIAEPWLTEFAAIYLGEESYRLEAPTYRRLLVNHFQKNQQYQSWHNNWELFGQENFQQLLALFNRNTWRAWRATGITGGMIPWALGHGWLRAEPAIAEKMVDREPWRPGTRGPFLSRTPAYAADPLAAAAWRMTTGGKALVENNASTLAWIADSGSSPMDVTDKTHHFWAGADVVKQIFLVNDTRQKQKYQARWSVKLDGAETLAQGECQGEMLPASDLSLPIQWKMPVAMSTSKLPGYIEIQANIGESVHLDRFDFILFAPMDLSGKPLTVDVLDPVGKTRAMLSRLGYRVQAWDGHATGNLLVIGREALSNQTALAANLNAWVKQGGRLVIMTQSPEWFAAYTRWRTYDGLSRRMYLSGPAHPWASAISRDELRDWAGFSTLQPDKPLFDAKKDAATPGRMPLHGWRASNRGALSSVAIELPHRSGWRPILRGEFDMAYTPLMELDFGQGRIYLCTLDFEDHIPVDPAATHLARRFFDMAATSPLAARHRTTLYLGDERGRRLLDDLGVVHQTSSVLDPQAGLVIVGPGASIGDSQLRSYLERSGRIFILPDDSTQGPLGLTRQAVGHFAGSLDVPPWPQAMGLNVADLHWRAEGAANLIKRENGWEVAGDGLLARLSIGRGVAVACQNDPGSLNADEKTYYRFTRWRQTRTLCQLLANLGAEFKADEDALLFQAQPGQSLAGTWSWKQTLTLPSADLAKAHEEPKPEAAVMEMVLPSHDDRNWPTLPMPMMLPSLVASDGQVVLRRRVQVPDDWAGQDLELSLGALDDFDHTFFDGQPVGRTDIQTPKYWVAPRTYRIPGKLVTPGSHVIAVILFDRYGDGGMVGPGSDMMLRPAQQRPLESYYHRDYRNDFQFGDDPYRYYRW